MNMWTYTIIYSSTEWATTKNGVGPTANSTGWPEIYGDQEPEGTWHQEFYEIESGHSNHNRGLGLTEGQVEHQLACQSAKPCATHPLTFNPL